MPSHIIALPGAISGASALNALIPDLCPHAAVWLSRDILNDVAEGCDGFDTMAARLAAAAAALPTKPVLFGYSMGARIALHALCTQPESWSGAILVSCHPGLTSPAEASARLEEDAAWAAHVRTAAWNDVLNDWESRQIFSRGTPPAAWLPRHRSAWEIDRSSLENRRMYAATALEIWSLGRQRDFRNTLASPPCPILWVTGANDIKFTKLANTISSPNRHWQHATIANSGHRVPWESPAILGTRITTWWQDL